MSARLRRSAIVAILATAWMLATAAAPVSAGHVVRQDVYFSAGYERQIDGRTCTAASVSMMMNFIARRDLRLSQRSILAYEQPRDALNDRIQRGSDPLGLSRAATYFSVLTGRPTTYRWEAYASRSSALRRAATQLALTGKPSALLVWHGGHAMVMTGFSASANPARTSRFTLYTVWISDPYGSAHREYPAASAPINTYLQTDATSYYDAKWYGRYIIVAPQN